jgi:glycosyltransferase involved in cell wall biosynthesis
MRLSVIIPVYNGRGFLGQALQALASSCRSPDEVLVVDDGSTDGSGTLARAMGARVISQADGPKGPARARNLGAEQAVGDILVFLDADVVVHLDTLARIAVHFQEEPDLSALFGSYDADPLAPGHVSRFKNLLHHFTHQRSPREASTFWVGCGAIRRDVFEALGGFFEGYGRPAVADIELGLRLKEAGGRILLDPEVLVTHLKAWTFVSLLKSDVFDRAVPWSRLILKQGRLPATLNLDFKSRVAALLAWTELILLILGFWRPEAWVGLILALMLQGLLSYRLYQLFFRKGGLRFLGAAMGLHHLYLLYSSLTFVVVAGQEYFKKHVASFWGCQRSYP